MRTEWGFPEAHIIILHRHRCLVAKTRQFSVRRLTKTIPEHAFRAENFIMIASRFAENAEWRNRSRTLLVKTGFPAIVTATHPCKRHDLNPGENDGDQDLEGIVVSRNRALLADLSVYERSTFQATRHHLI
jgi:hypothetical protein